MIDVAIIFAVFRRLTGYPLDSQGRPLRDATGKLLNIENSPGIRIPLIRQGQGQNVLSTDNPEGTKIAAKGWNPGTFQQLKVYQQGIDTRRWADVFPAVSFTISDIQPGENGFFFSPADGIDGIDAPGAQGTQTITNNVTGSTYAVPDTLTTRAQPEPWDFFLTLNLYSRDSIEIAAMESALRSLFKQKGSIIVDQVDGTHVVLDMLFERYSIMDQGEPYDPQRGTAANAPGFLHRAYTYRIEANQDNTSADFGPNEFTVQNTILERLLEITTIEGRLLTEALETIRLEDLT